MKRTFVAIPVFATEQVISFYNEIRERCRVYKIKWVVPHNFHVTLAFLGHTDENIIPEISFLLKEKISKHSSFSITIGPVGIFRNGAVWLGIDVSEELKKLNDEVNNVLAHFGFDIEKRLFRPHFTIGRLKDEKSYSDLKQSIMMYNKSLNQKQRIDKVVFYESMLKAEGPVYSELSVFLLQ